MRSPLQAISVPFDQSSQIFFVVGHVDFRVDEPVVLFDLSKGARMGRLKHVRHCVFLGPDGVTEEEMKAYGCGGRADFVLKIKAENYGMVGLDRIQTKTEMTVVRISELAPRPETVRGVRVPYQELDDVVRQIKQEETDV